MHAPIKGNGFVNDETADSQIHLHNKANMSASRNALWKNPMPQIVVERYAAKPL